MLRLFSRFCTAVKPQLLQTTAEITANPELLAELNQRLQLLQGQLKQKHIEQGKKLQTYLTSSEKKSVNSIYSKLQALDPSEVQYIKFRVRQLQQENKID